jgi:LPXTG-motif cell wall-anchored protein
MRLTTATTAAVTVVLAIAASPAWARPELHPIAATPSSNADPALAAAKRPPATAYSRPDKSLIAVSSAPTPADLIAAQRAAAHPTASLDRFALIGVHKIPLGTTSGNSNPDRFHFGDAAIGAGVTVGLVLLGIAGLLVARRRREPLHT